MVQGTRGIGQLFPNFEISLEATDVVQRMDEPARDPEYNGPHHSYRSRAGDQFYDQSEHPQWRSMLERAANRSQAIDFPGFTKGAWKTRQPLDILVD